MKQIAIYIATFLIVCACTSRGKYTAMRHALDSINTLNRTDRPFTPADVEPYVGYFDRHGNSNDRMLAHYLLGRAYHEKGEAPMALRCYQEAVTAADTTDEGCDYAQLCRVYAQMGDIFFGQNMMGQQLACMKTAKTYAWKGNDTIAALMCYEQMSLAHERKNHLDSALLIAEDVSHLYEQYGYPSDAAIALGSVIEILIKKGNTAKAKEYLMEYESKSGYFDTLGNIMPGREIYYKTKGLYYLYTYKLDSARLYFEKELAEGKDFNNQNAGAYGLAMYYDKVNKPDSASKYYRYAYIMNDSMYGRMEAEVIERMNALYNYTRFQEVAKTESEKAALEREKKFFTLTLLVVTILIAGTTIYKLRDEKEKKQFEYIQNLKQLEELQSEVLLLREHADDYEEIITKKERLVIDLNKKIKELRGNVLYDHIATDKAVRESDIFKILQRKQNVGKLTDDELHESRRLVLENYPEVNALLFSRKYKLSENDFNVCILLRLGFKSKEISNLLDVTQGRISQICSKLLHEIFGKEKGGAAELIEKLHELH